MAPKRKSKAKKNKGASNAPKKQFTRVAKRAQAPADLQKNLLGTEKEFSSDEALTNPLQGISNCLVNMMSMLLERSQKVHGTDRAVADQTSMPLTNLSGPQLGRKRARNQNSLAGDLGLNETVHQRVQQRLRQVPPVRRNHMSGG